MTRLGPQPGERIDRARRLSFTFDGKAVTGYAGDTIASALLAHGRRTFSRSFKYHRPRGELCGCGQCANSLVDVDGRPNVRACGELLADGMRVGHQNAWPSLEHDVMSATDRFGGPFTPVGFYYKTFIRPRRLWPVYEKVLRSAAGLGRLPTAQDEREWVTEYRRRHCDLLVVGGGIAGLTAAITAAERGLDVVLCDEDAEPGGRLAIEGGHDEAARLRADALAAGVELLAHGSAVGYFDGLVPVWQGSTLHQVRAPQHVIATGTIQQPLVFHDNDLPGVMLSGGARRLAALYAVKPGERAVVATVDDQGVDDALALHAHGVDVAIVADLRPSVRPELVTALSAAGIPLLAGAGPVRAQGRAAVTGATIAVVDARGRAQEGTTRSLDCDLLAVSGGGNPALSLVLQGGGRAGYDDRIGGFRLAETPPGVHVAGAAAGHGGREAAALSGQIAALAAIGDEVSELRSRLTELDRDAAPVAPPAAFGDGGRGKRFVDLDEDVTTKDVKQAVAEGYDSLELSKRYTTVTMGPTQGRFSQIPSVRAIAAATGLPLDDVGLTTARPPWTSVPLGVLAGRPLEPAKRSALHERHRALGADVRWAGDWRRAYHYGDPQAEAGTVQTHAGLIDVSTLGKLLVQGPDAAELLDRLYPNRMSNLKPGRIRYGVMLSDAGRITDDGTVCRLDEETFYVTTTSSGATGVEQQMTWWLAAWGLDARVTDLTQGVGAMNLAGPLARGVLQSLTDLDCSAAGLRYLDARQAIVCGVPALVLRIGFVGEVGYELHCPGPQAAHLWDGVLEAGGGQVRPFGLEPQRVLRLQKLHVIVGQDTDSEATPLNSGMEWIVKLDKEQDFLGRWALERERPSGEETRLVGFTVPSHDVMVEGAVVLHQSAPAGQVTSARWSPHLGVSMGMATVPEILAADGTRISISYEDRTYDAIVTTRPIYDPDGEVLRG